MPPGPAPYDAIRARGDVGVEIEELDERIRDVRQGVDGWIYFLTDSPNGGIFRVER